MASWNPIDTSYSNCPILPSREMGWRQRVSAVTLNAVAWGVVFPVLLITALSVIGMMIEGVASHSEQLDRCKRQAATPYEYHQCR